MGRMSSVFIVDGSETDSKLSVSEWWLEPNTEGPHMHSHTEDHVFYILEGTVAILVDENWLDVAKGSYVFIPGGHKHSFENRSASTAGFMSINTPGGFEQMMPNIVHYLAENPLGDTNR
ncbi:cupin domain-containing protein [Alginatibacterium sediminis]|uniref:Cupin domain-containing protein n=2 Tax=Alginatibacterium sediminis TaxID=2164068 RepID=A0A420EIR3_9ALTE|nr:cupin domain-containing protein [Alginatibacterium sediminis]